MAKQGRPRKKVTRFARQVRALPEEWEEIDRAAETEGILTSTWMRTVCLKQAKKIAKEQGE